MLQLVPEEGRTARKSFYTGQRLVVQDRSSKKGAEEGS